jgi:gamma-glutamyltranspeptidase/glutathione hydrolase
MLGDPDFFQNPIEKLTSPSYIDDLSKSISLSKTSTLPSLELGVNNNSKEKTETTHFSVLDSNGNSVAMTLTLNGNYGSGVTSEKFGIALNNEMDDFTTLPGEPNMYGLIQGEGNLVQAGKRPLSSMSPTLITSKNGSSEKVVLSLGAPGGPTIISGVFQVLYRNLYRNKNLDISVQAPRVHHQFLPNVLYIDEDRFQEATKQGLIKKGHKLEERTFIGRVSAVSLKESGTLEAAYDSRGEGAAGGY